MLWLLLLAMLAGALLPLQAGVNAQLRLASRMPIPLGAAWAGGAWWHWVGGLPGAAPLIAAVVAGQMLALVALDG